MTSRGEFTGGGGGIYCASNGVALHAGNIKNNDADHQGGGKTNWYEDGKYEIKEEADGEVHAVVANTYAPKDLPGSENAKDPQDPQNSQGSQNHRVGTGDKNSPLLWGIIAATALLCAAGTVVYRRKAMK